MKIRRVTLLVCGVLFLVFFAPGFASANYFGPSNGNGCCLFADNGEHTFYYAEPGNQTYRDAMNHSFHHLDNGTKMTTKKVDPSSVTDVWYWADYFGGCCIHGQWDCVSTNSAGECESADVMLNRSNLDGEGQHAKDHTACHEIGHSVGLDHAYQINSCLEQGIDEPRWMASHDKDHINSRGDY